MNQAINPELSRIAQAAERETVRLLANDEPWLCRDDAPAELFTGETCALSLEHQITLDEHPDDAQLWHVNAAKTLIWDATGARASVSPNYGGGS